jgi:hydroxylamine reductase (hybrid-cluster protein)
MLLLKAIPKEWDTVAQMYCNGMQMANVTFDGVRDAIMAEFECTARPAQLAHTRQIKYLLSSVKVSLPVSKSRESQTQLLIQPLKLLMVS